MKKRFALICLIIAFIGMVARNRLPLVAAQTIATGERVTPQILQSTVQIFMYQNGDTAESQRVRLGLGTLVRYQDQTLIVTHDHWSLLDETQGEVAFHNAQGAFLLRLSMSDFHELIRYRDGGTMILASPVQVAIAVVPVAPASADMLSAGDTLQVVRRTHSDSLALEVIEVTLESLQQEATPARLNLRGVQGAQVAPGDSGGGAWMGGKLLGNVWSGGVAVTQSASQRLTGEQTETATNLIIAALQPLAALEDGQASSDTVTETALRVEGPSGVHLE